MAGFRKYSGFIVLALSFLIIPLPWIFAWVLCVLVHELGHLMALWILGIPVYVIKIGFTGIRMESAPITPWQRLLAIGAGPVFGLALTSLGELWPELALFALVQNLWNLLPVYPLDGGRFLRTLAEIAEVPWAYRLCVWLEKGALVFLVVTGTWGALELDMGLLPLMTSIWAMGRLWKEKYLANGRRSGYNIPNPNCEVCYDRIDSADPADGAETCPVYRR